MSKKRFCQRIGGDCPHVISKNKKNCFIMMAYNHPYSPKIEAILKRAIKLAFKLKPELAKNIKQTQSGDMYCKTVCRPINEATLCIADFTYNNSNVGFEFGIAQGMDKPVIVTRYMPKEVKLTKAEKSFLKKVRLKGAIQYSEVPYNIPADISGIFRVDYSNEDELKKKLKEGFKIKK